VMFLMFWWISKSDKPWLGKSLIRRKWTI
jgi:hypothetical protein